MPWANGRGTSYEIASDHNAAGEWTWRVAIAPVVVDGPFSSLPGVDRELVVIEGEGMVLDVDGKSVECMPSQVVQFSGDSTTFARLVDGPVVDLGLMMVRGSIAGSMEVVVDAGEILSSRVIVALSEKVEINIGGFLHVLDHLDAIIQVDENVQCLVSGIIARLPLI